MIFASVGIAALAYAVRSFNSEVKPPPNGFPDKNLPPPTKLEEQKITLKGLSAVWTKGEMRKIPINELSAIWKGPPKETPPDLAVRRAAFARSEITTFYENTIKDKPFFTNKQLDVIIALLQILDRDGNCESVVNKHPQEAEKTIAADA